MSNTIGKYQVYYERIRKEVEKIKDDNDYLNLSKAFAHWYLKNFCNVSDNDIGELIIDGFGDNGIDAIIKDGTSLKLYQFKFPEKVGNITKKIEESTALKLVNGYKKLTSNRKSNIASENFKYYREMVKNESIFNYEFIFVSFTEELSVNAKDALHTSISDIKSLTGNIIECSVEDKKKICDKIDRAQKHSRINIDIKYGNLLQGYNIDKGVNSWVGFCSAKDIISSVQDVLDVIFDENIRNYEGDNSVNSGIYSTASDEDNSKYFYFYHNGIVFICDNCKNSVGNQTASLQSAAIVNGCQTVVALNKALNDGCLRDDVFVPIRIIETDDIDLRAKITEYLNSQNKIRDSYFLSNNTFIRELQEELLQKGFYLERLANEYSYKLSLNKINENEYPKDKVLQLEKVIQVYVAYYNNKDASTAKRGKNELFNKDSINDLIVGINGEKVLESQKIYNEVCKVITVYRRCRRVERNDEFLNYMGIKVSSLEEYNNIMNRYLFMNTADLLLLNGVANIKNDDTFENKLKKVINICSDVINAVNKLSPSLATKTASIFEQVQNKCVMLNK